MTYRIPTQDLSSSDDAQHGLRWNARIPVPISVIDDDPGLAFHSQFERMRPGDEVRVCAYERGTGAWRDGLAPVREIATYHIVAKAKAGTASKVARLRAVRIEPIFEVPAPREAALVEGVVALDIVPIGNKCFEVRDRKGNVIETFVDQKQAEEFRDREQGRGIKGVVGLDLRKGFGKFMVCDSADGRILAEFNSKPEAEAYMMAGGQKAA